MFDDLLPITGQPDAIDPRGQRLRMFALLLAAPLTVHAAVSLAGLGVMGLTQVIPGFPKLPDEFYIALYVGGDILALLGAIAGILLFRSFRPVFRAFAEVLWMLALPIWGFVINAGLDPCDACATAQQAVNPAGAPFVAGGWIIGLIAYAIARWKPDPMRTADEIAVLAAIGVGTVTCTAIGIHFAPAVPMGVLFGVVGMPLASPVALALVWGATVAWRLNRHPDSSRVAGIATAALSGGIVADLLLNVLFTSRPGLFMGALGQTCGWTLSTLVPPPADCHYLCTVAAQGHPALVRPTRLGRRRGKVIVVNRQLAVANAFEDLLRERVPRTARVLRRVYDRTAFPICQYLRSPWVADLVFVMMLPMQMAFEVVLRVFDRDPEARIDRMYR